MTNEFRYVLLRTGSGTTELIDALVDSYTFVGLKNVDAMGLTRSDLEELKEQIDKELNADGEPARGTLDLVYLTAFQHRRAVELGNEETDPKLRRRYMKFVELLNEAQQQLEPNYAPHHVDKPTLVDEKCSLCGQMRKVIKYTRVK